MVKLLIYLEIPFKLNKWNGIQTAKVHEMYCRNINEVYLLHNICFLK